MKLYPQLGEYMLSIESYGDAMKENNMAWTSEFLFFVFHIYFFLYFFFCVLFFIIIIIIN